MAPSFTGRPDTPVLHLSIARDFSATPGGRYRIQGPNSGEQFREEALIPRFDQAQRENTLLVVDLDGVFGYGPSFLEEAFGGLVREKKSLKAVQSVLRIVSEKAPYDAADIERYMREALNK
jgi:hypothetical protein